MEPHRAGEAEATIRSLPAVLIPHGDDPALVMAGAARSGARPKVGVLVDPDLGDVARSVQVDGAEYIVARCTDVDASIAIAHGLMAVAIRIVPVLGIRGDDRAPGLDVSTIVLLTDERLRDMNVPVPVLDDRPRGALWDSLRTVRIEEHHQLVEVDGRPALDELGVAAEHASVTQLASGAAGVLAGRMAAANRRWRRQV